MGKLKDKIAVVTGGSSGIGLETVKMLAKEGASVVVGYHNGQERAEKLIKSLPGKKHSTIKIQLQDPLSSNKLKNHVEAVYGKLDILVNSAGFTRPISHKDLDQLDEQLFDQILIANARGPYSIIRSLMSLLQLSEEAVVINVSSISAFTGSGSNIAYCASKAAVDTITMSLARVFGPKIRFLCVSPAAVATDFVEGRDRAALETISSKTPLNRVVEPEDIALSIIACVTHLKTATGTKIVVDGGRHL